MDVKKFPPIKPPVTLQELRDRILANCEDIEINATSAERGTDFIMEDIFHYLNHLQ